MKKIRLKENKKIERFKCDNLKMMQLTTNSKNYHKKKLEEKLLIQLNNLNNTLNKNKVLELIEIAGDSRKYLVRNFMSGISKGIGIGIGFSIITALIIYVMQNRRSFHEEFYKRSEELFPDDYDGCYLLCNGICKNKRSEMCMPE